MKGSFKKTTVLFLCVVLGLTIGIGSAFGQKLADQSQIQGEKPVDQAEKNIKKEIIPEHLKPNHHNDNRDNIDSPQKNSPQVKGEKPLDGPKTPHVQKRIAPEVQEPNTQKDSLSDPSQEKDTTPSRENKNQDSSNQDSSKQQDHPSAEKDNTSVETPNSDSDSPSEKSPEREQPPVKTPDEPKEQESNEESQPQKDRPSQSEKQSEDEDVEPKTQEKFSNSQDKEKTEIEIPEMKIEKPNGETVDVTSIIEDIFGDVKSSKEETEIVQNQLQNEQLTPKIAQHNQLNKEPIDEEPNQEISINNPPRTIKHGTMPMTASNDLQGVLVGLVIAAVGILFVLFRKGEPR